MTGRRAVAGAAEHAAGSVAKRSKYRSASVRRVARNAGKRCELRMPDARVDVGHVELAAGKRDVARAVGEVDDAVEPQRLDARRFGLVR